MSMPALTNDGNNAEGTAIPIRLAGPAGQGDQGEEDPTYENYYETMMETDVNGEPLTTDTGPNLFRTWQAYRIYCAQGPKMTLRFGHRDEAGEFIVDHTLVVPLKLLQDHAGYFAAMHRSGGFKETSNLSVDYDDIEVTDFQNLLAVVESGLPRFRVAFGDPEHQLRDLVRIFTLTDRFDMPQTGELIKEATMGYLAHVGHLWDPNMGANEAYPPGPVTHDQRAIARDLLSEYMIARDAEDLKQPLDPKNYILVLVRRCPQAILRELWEEEDDEARLALGEAFICF